MQRRTCRRRTVENGREAPFEGVMLDHIAFHECEVSQLKCRPQTLLSLLTIPNHAGYMQAEVVSVVGCEQRTKDIHRNHARCAGYQDLRITILAPAQISLGDCCDIFLEYRG